MGKCGAKLGGVVRRQVDFVHHTIEGERDCFIGRDAVDIVDEKRLESSDRAQDLPIGPKTLPRDFQADSSRRQKVVRSGEAKERQVRRNLPDGWRENLHRRQTSIPTSRVKSHTTPARRFPRAIARVGAGTGRVGTIHSRPVSRCYPTTISSCPASFTAVDLTVALLAGHQVRARQCRLSHQRSTTFEPMSVRKV